MRTSAAISEIRKDAAALEWIGHWVRPFGNGQRAGEALVVAVPDADAPGNIGQVCSEVWRLGRGRAQRRVPLPLKEVGVQQNCAACTYLAPSMPVERSSTWITSDRIPEQRP